MKNTQIIGAIIIIISLIGAWFFYDWKLAVIIYLAITGNNIEQNKNH